MSNTATNENADGPGSGPGSGSGSAGAGYGYNDDGSSAPIPMTPLRTLTNSIGHQFISPRWATAFDEAQQARALASGIPIDIPHTIVNPSAAFSLPAAHGHAPSPQPKRLMPQSWRNGPQQYQQQPPPPVPRPTSASSGNASSRHPFEPQPQPAPPAMYAPAQAPTFRLHRRRDLSPPPPARVRPPQAAGHSNHDEPDSPPSPPIPPTIRSSARGTAAGAVAVSAASRPHNRSAPALAVAAEPLAPETSHLEWDEGLDEGEDDDDDEPLATIRPPRYHARRPPAASRPRLMVSTATAMTPYHQPQALHQPAQHDLHRASTPILGGQEDADLIEINSGGRMTRSRARQLQQESLGYAVMSYMQHLFDAFTSFTSTAVSAVLSLLSLCIARPIRWLSNQTSPLFTFSFLFLLVLLLLSWALEPASDPTPSQPQPTTPHPHTTEIQAPVHQTTEMDHAIMQLAYQQDAAEAADAALIVQLREEVSAVAQKVVSERIAEVVESSVERAVDEVVASVLDQVHELSLAVSELTDEAANLTLRMTQPDPIGTTTRPALGLGDNGSNHDTAPEVPAADPSPPPPPLINYAAFTTGARALRQYSSPTHKFPMHPSAVIGGWLPARIIPWFMRPGVQAHGHNWALHHDMQRGSCWATPLGAGGREPAQLTVRLARPVQPRAVAVWHHARGGKEAPRDMRVYGRRVRDREWNVVARGEYVTGQGEAGERQVFEVGAGVDDEVDHVRFVVDRNWGSEKYTCLYRVEVLAPAPEIEVEAATVEGGGEEGMDVKVSDREAQEVEVVQEEKDGKVE